jgi:hypothetical protein
MGLNIITKKRENKCVAKKKIALVEYVKKNAVD